MMFKKTAMLLAMLLACGLGTARASLPGGATAVPDPFFLQFDEFGNGSYQANGDPTVFNLPGYIVATDPTGGINGPVLQWTLPELVGTGDQVFYDRV
jgi:hypothetical protein